MNRRATQKLLNDNNVVQLVADMTEDNAEANALLIELGNTGTAIPFMAIFPGRGEPVTLDGVITKNGLISKIEEALERQGSVHTASKAVVH